MSNDIKSKCTFFTDDISLFSVVRDTDSSENDFNHDLEKIREWAFQWKMKFPLNRLKNSIQQEKTVFTHPVVYFNNSTAIHKHLGMILDFKLNYEHHLQSAFSKINKTICPLRKPTLPRKSPATIHKSCIRSHLDYGDVVYDRASSKALHQSLKFFKQSAATAATGAIR